MARYYISQAANHDISVLYLFGLDRFGEAKADEFLDQLYDHFDRLAEQPLQYVAVDHLGKGLRRSPFESYSVYFSVLDAGGVRIVRILGRQEPYGALNV